MGWKIHEITAPIAKARVQEALGAGNTAKSKASQEASGDPIARPFLSSDEAKRPIRRLKQNHAPKMKQTEARWFGQINCKFPNFPPIRIQAKTFKLANGVDYTPDFSASCWPFLDDFTGETVGSARETCWEVKGPKAWDDAIVKIKVAAHEWPEIHWIFCWEQNGKWQQQTVLP